jgi:drug/metabolite transporter (DMT)-like permease
MNIPVQKPASPLLVIIAFATIYIVWGSTYFFIQVAVKGGIPPFLLGATRFTIAGLLMAAWCIIKGEKIFIVKNILRASVSGILLLFISIGAAIWVERILPSGMVAIVVSCLPIWIVLLDKANWRVNFKNRSTIVGLLIGLGGIVLLFSDELGDIFKGGNGHSNLPWMLLLVLGNVAWAAGSLYSKYKPTTGSVAGNAAWQMLSAGLVFTIASLIHHEFTGFVIHDIPAKSWFALWYLILLGSIAAYSAYVWLLQVRTATQVSTTAYVNPVIAVILGVMFGGEGISMVQVAGLFVILVSVLLINLSKYRKGVQEKKMETLEPVDLPGLAKQVN